MISMYQCVTLVYTSIYILMYIHNIYYKLYSLYTKYQFTMYFTTVQYITYTVLRIMYVVHCTSYNVSISSLIIIYTTLV